MVTVKKRRRMKEGHCCVERKGHNCSFFSFPDDIVGAVGECMIFKV